MRTGLDILPLPAEQDKQLATRCQKYQARYKERFDVRRAGAAPTWKAGDRVRVRDPRTGTVTNKTTAVIDRQTGPVSYRLADGQRVHARRLAGAPAAADASAWPVGVDGEVSSEVDSFPRRPVQLDFARSGSDSSVSQSSPCRVRTASTPAPRGTPRRSPSPIPAARRSTRVSRPPDRYSLELTSHRHPF